MNVEYIREMIDIDILSKSISIRRREEGQEDIRQGMINIQIRQVKIVPFVGKVAGHALIHLRTSKSTRFGLEEHSKP